MAAVRVLRMHVKYGLKVLACKTRDNNVIITLNICHMKKLTQQQERIMIAMPHLKAYRLDGTTHKRRLAI